jgi:hypothetical protein
VSQWTDGIQKDLSFLTLLFGTTQTHVKKLPSQIAMIDLGSQYDDLRLNHLSLVELVEGQRSNNYLSAKKL